MSLFSPLFRGELLTFARTEASRELGEAGRELVLQAFGSEPDLLDAQAFRDALTLCRTRLTDPVYRRLAFNCLQALDLPVDSLRMDHVRLRAVSPGLETVTAAAPVFYCHRDTWYGNPSCQINAWLPLHAVDRSNSFCFFADYFERAIGNDSHLFRAAEFGAQGGFGRVSAQPTESAYPRALMTPDGPSQEVKMEPDELLLFSAAHLHQTLPNRSPATRFSLDFRFYCTLELQSGRGAPDPDNRSKGLLIDGYKSLPEL